MDYNNGSHKASEEEKFFSMSDYLSLCMSKWQWFLCSIIICLGIGILYILRKEPVFTRTMSVLVKSNEEGMSPTDMQNAFSNFGFGASNAKVNNELIAMTSPSVMADVVEMLRLNINYSQKETFHPVTLYDETCPVTVTFADLDLNQGASLKMELNPDGSYVLYKFRTAVNGKKVKYADEVNGKLGFDPVKTPFGTMMVMPSAKFTGKLTEPIVIYITRMGFQNAVESYMGRLKGELADSEAEVIDLSINDVCVPRAVDVLNAIVDVYNNEWIEDKNKIAKATSLFISERLNSLEKELSQVDGDISDYRSQNLVPDFETASKVYLEQVAAAENMQIEMVNRLALMDYFIDYINNPKHEYDVLPMNLGLETGGNGLIEQVAEYNNVLLQRDNLLEKSSAENPLVRQFDDQLSGLRVALLKSVKSQAQTLREAIANFDGEKEKTGEKMTKMPQQAKYLLSVERRQKVMEELYIFLLQKREENDLSQTFAAANTRVITPPYGPLRPVSPKKGLIVVMCLLIGLGIPGLYFYMVATNDTKVRSRRDIDNLPVPFAGEIPFVGKRDSRIAAMFRSKKKNKKVAERPKAIIEAGKRDVPNEAFRVIRSNLEFMIGKEDKCQAVMLTSFNPGSGKSFIAFNLGASFGLKHRRVLLIDGDLRHGSLSTYVGSPKKGVTDYLTGKTDDWKNLVVSLPDASSVQMLPLGHMPPNPAELLENGRLGELIEQARNEYDLILMDCPPIDIVVDTQIIEKYTDRTIFVIRAGLLEKRAVSEIAELYDSKKYKHMSLILNGTDSAHSRYYTYGTYEGVTAE